MTITFAHGFTQNARSWDTTIELLAERGIERSRLRAIDLPGHGAAGDVCVESLWGAADHLLERGGTGTYVGYSMGGRVALHAALASPERVERLALIGATPGIVDDVERAERRRADEALADHIETVGVGVFIDEWLANPLFAGLTDGAAQRDERIRNTADGLAASLRSTGTGTQEPLWGRLVEVSCPVLLVVGADDTKFLEIARRMSERLPDASLAVIDGAGHSAHLERPERTADALASWLPR